MGVVRTHRYGGSGTHGGSEARSGARDENPFCDVLSILCVLSSFVESGNGFVDPRLISSSSESMSRV